MPFSSARADREFDRFKNVGGETAVRVAIAEGISFSSWTRDVVTVTNTPLLLAASPGQVFIRIVPLGAGTYAYGPDSGISAANAENFNQNSPIEIQTSANVYVVRSAGSGSVVIYRGIA